SVRKAKDVLEGRHGNKRRDVFDPIGIAGEAVKRVDNLLKVRFGTELFDAVAFSFAQDIDQEQRFAQNAFIKKAREAERIVDRIIREPRAQVVWQPGKYLFAANG